MGLLAFEGLAPLEENACLMPLGAPVNVISNLCLVVLSHTYFAIKASMRGNRLLPCNLWLPMLTKQNRPDMAVPMVVISHQKEGAPGEFMALKSCLTQTWGISDLMCSIWSELPFPLCALWMIMTYYESVAPYFWAEPLIKELPPSPTRISALVRPLTRLVAGFHFWSNAYVST